MVKPMPNRQPSSTPPRGTHDAEASSSIIPISSDSDSDLPHRRTRCHRPPPQLPHPLHLIYVSSDSDEEEVIKPSSSQVISVNNKDRLRAAPTTIVDEMVRSFATITLTSDGSHDMEIKAPNCTAEDPIVVAPSVVKECPQCVIVGVVAAPPSVVTESECVVVDLVDALPNVVKESLECVVLDSITTPPSAVDDSKQDMVDSIIPPPSVVEGVEEGSLASAHVKQSTGDGSSKELTPPTTYVYNTRSKAKQALPKS